jgi:alpha-L-arabinofuranosidase
MQRFRHPLKSWPVTSIYLCAAMATASGALSSHSVMAQANIEVDAGQTIGTVSKELFGQNIEYEHGTISGGEQNMNGAHGMHSGGLWAEMLRDRKFEEGDLDRDGVANAWVPLERVTNHYTELLNGKDAKRKYGVDDQVYYGGGASQAIHLLSDGTQEGAVAQVRLQFQKGKTYNFYVYLKLDGGGSASVDFGSTWPKTYTHKDFPGAPNTWTRYEASFTAPEDTQNGRVQINIKGKGTLWVDSASLMPAETFHGMRSDVMEALKSLPVPILRYPGGCFADLYHWKDGIGDRDKRPERFSTVWNEWEPNDFGFDDFMLFAETIHAKPHMTVNYLTGTPEEAAEWAEYANGAAGTAMGALRAQNGHAAPYGVNLWAVGNEAQQLCSDEYIGANKVALYAARYPQYRDALLAKDPGLEVMAGGAGPGPLKWNHDLLDRVKGIPSLASSIYTGNNEMRKDDIDTKYINLEDFYRREVTEPLDFDRQVNDIISSIGDRMPDHPFVAITEFQSWWLTEKVDEDFRLANALYLGMCYHSLFRHSKQVGIAEIESVINVQGVLEVSQTSVKKTPEYFAGILYQKHSGSVVLKTTASSQGVEFDANLPALDAIATLSEDRHTLYLAVVNRAESTPIQTQIVMQGWKPDGAARSFELNGPDKVAANPFGNADVVNIHEKAVSLEPGALEYRFPAHSITILEFSGQ